MKLRATRWLSIGVAIMGIVHIAATITPVIAGKLVTLPVNTQHAFIYMSLMCGALLVMGGFVVNMLSNKLKKHPLLRKPLMFILWILAIDGILAVCMMPANPCAWVILCLTLLLLIVQLLDKT